MQVVDKLDESFRHCQQLARASGSNFYFAFLTLPRDLYRDMCALYAFMRMTDDWGDDESLTIVQRQHNITHWREQLQLHLDGAMSDNPVLHALNDVVQRREIPELYLLDVIAGVESDLHERSFATFAELQQYCYQVAGAVGLCCLHVWGFDNTPAARQSGIDCGTAFQLTNILRDLAEDADRGRVYLPTEDLIRFHYAATDIQQRKHNKAYTDLMQFQVERAKRLYLNAAPVLDSLPFAGRCIQAAMFDLYGSLLLNIQAKKYDVYTQRIRLSRPKKLWLTVRARLGYQPSVLPQMKRT